MAWMGLAWHMVWPGGYHMVYIMAWWASHGIWLWPARQGMGLGIVCGMDWRAWHGVWYGLAGKERYMVWPGGHGYIYGMAWRPWHGICYGLAGITWHMVLSGGHRMVYGMAWRGMPWYVQRYLWIYSIKACQLEVLFTCTRPVHK